MLIVQALGEEMNFTRRIVACLGQSLARHSVATRWIDLANTGDSADRDEVALHDWFHDLDLATTDWVHSSHVPVVIVGVRAGAFLAAAWVAARNAPYDVLSLAGPADVASWSAELRRKQRLAAMLGKTSQPEVPPKVAEEVLLASRAPVNEIAIAEAESLGPWWQQAQAVDPQPLIAAVESALGLEPPGKTQPNAARNPHLSVQAAQPVMGVTETPARIGECIGLWCEPSEAPKGAVLIIAGQPQTRSGALRMFTLLARTLAAHGFASLRIDLPGWGDSPGAARPFDGYGAEITACLEAMHARLPACRLHAFGLCDGATALLLAAPRLAEVPGMARLLLLNPWLRSEASRDRALVAHHYRAEFSLPRLTRRLLRGELGIRQVRSFLGHLRGSRQLTPDASHERTVAATLQHDLRLTVLIAGADLTGQEAAMVLGTPAWQAVSARLALHTIAEADHICSRPEHRDAMHQLVLQAIMSNAGPTLLNR